MIAFHPHVLSGSAMTISALLTPRGIAVAAAALVVGLPGGASAATIAHTRGEVQAIAADGSKVAIADAGTTGHCRRMLLADAHSGRTVALTHDGDPVGSVGSTYCVSLGLSRFAFGHALALAGSTVYWSFIDGGNELEQWIAAAAPGRRPRLLAGVPTEVDWDVGPFAGPLAASRTTFAFGVYARDWLPPGCDPTGFGTPCTGTSEPRRGAVHGHGVHVALPPDGGILAAADAGRLAVILHDGRVLVTTVAGRGLALVTPAGTPLAAAITRRRLAVLTRGRISVYTVPGGRRLASWAAPGATSLDAEGRVAVYGTNGRRIVALNLRTGSRRIVVRHRRHDLLATQIAAGGIFYAYGRIVARIATRIP